MLHDFGHFEEDHLGKPYDLRLLVRLLPYVRPYRLLLTVSIVLVVLITLLDLSLPYITKIAIDRYIVPVDRIPSDDRLQPAPADDRHWLSADLSDAAVARLMERHPHLFVVENDRVRIAYDDLPALAPGELAILRSGHLKGVSRIALVFVAVILVHFMLGFVQMMIMEYTGQRVMHDLRMHLFDHVQSRSMAFFSRNPVGRLVTRVTNDIQNMHELFTSILVFVFKDLFLLMGISVVLLTINWQLALVSFAVLPLVGIVSAHFSNQARDAFRTLRIKVAEINTRFSETIQGIQVIQLFLQERRNARRFRTLNHENYLAGMRQIHVFAVFMPVIELLGAVSVGVVIWYGGGRVIAGFLSLGALVAFISYMKMFFRPIRDIAEKYNVMQNAMASAERIFLLMDTRDAIPESAAARDSQTEPGDRVAEIRFESVTFGYRKETPVLDEVSFAVGRGETLAVVGPTGSGKTSLINLLFRFYDPLSGRVTVNGQDIRQMDTTSLRRAMALVMQEPYLFSASVRENIFPGNGKVSDQRIAKLLALSNCDTLVARLPEGLDTRIGEGGRPVSSGERQLISIARAFARDPNVIVLDEATSYIDSETEEKIHEALDNLMAGRTAIVVAHRLSTARSADRIVVLHRGRIIESGTHDQLMHRQGFYARMVRLQR